MLAHLRSLKRRSACASNPDRRRRERHDGTPVRTAPHPREAVAGDHSTIALLPIMAVVAIAFLIIGFVLPVLPLHVHIGLGLSTFIVGVVTGSQFVASLISRVWAGQFADRRGAKRAVIVGLCAA